MKKLLFILLILTQSVALAQVNNFEFYRHQADSLIEVLERPDSHPDSSHTIALLDTLGIVVNRLIFGFPPEEQPRSFYQGCSLSEIFASWKEGKGMPIGTDSLNNRKLATLVPIVLPYWEKQDSLNAVKLGIMHPYYFGFCIWEGYIFDKGRFDKLRERHAQIAGAFEKAAEKLSMPKDSLLLVQLIDSLCGISEIVKERFLFLLDDVAMIPLQAAQRIARQKFHNPAPGYIRVLQRMSKLVLNGETASDVPNHIQIVEEYVDVVKAYKPEDRKVNSIYYYSLLYLSRVYRYDTYQYQKAVSAQAEVLALVESQMGKLNYTYTAEACNLAQAWQMVERNDLADSLFQEVIAIERTLTTRPENRDIEIRSLPTIFDFYFETQQYRKAESICFEILDSRRKNEGEASLNYALALKKLGGLYYNDSQYRKADSVYVAAAQIIETVRGRKDMLYLQMLMLQGGMYSRTGNYEKAEALYLEAKVSMEELLKGKYDGWVNFGDYDQQTYDYPACLTNLAVLYKSIGQHERADELYRNALSIYRTATTTRKIALDYRIALLLNNMGVTYWDWGKDEEAEKCLLESMSIYEKAYGKQSASYYLPLNSLGDLYFSKRLYEKADSIYRVVIPFWEQSKKSNHRRFLAGARQYQAMLYENTGRAAQAEPLFRAAKEDFAISKGKNHPEYAACLFSQGCYYARLGKNDQATAALTEANSIEQNLVKSGCAYLSEGELQQLADKTRRSAGFIDSWLTKQTGKTNAVLTALCYDNALFDKGFLLQARLAVDQAVAKADSNTQALFGRWKDLQRHLAVQYTASVRDSAYIAGLEAQADAMEKVLTRQVAALGQARRQVDWREVQRALQPGEAALEFVHYRYTFPKNTDPESSGYAALLLKPGAKQPQFISLFEEKQLDSLFGHTAIRKTDYVNSLYTLADRGVTPVDAPHKSLYELLWQPLEKELNTPSSGGGRGEVVKTIYFSPAGLLHRLNLGAIPIPVSEESLESPTLADRYRLVQLGSTRNLVIPAERRGDNNDALLYGGIRYDMDSTALRQANSNLAARNVADSRGLSFAYADTSSRGGDWRDLIKTRIEVKNIESALKKSGIPVVLRTGYDATEESFKRIGQSGLSPRVLHVATHGFFFSDPGRSVQEEERLSSAVARGGQEGGVFRISEHPMIRSGLILAGANQAWKTGKALAGLEDGILTAYEISQMNLSNTELVVLSACETGLGDIQGNEGVYGLQRAFKIAGAKYLIMSLWVVDDYATQELMELLYSKWLDEKMTIPEAFRAAQQAMREKYGNKPYYWAGFVLVE